MVMMYVDAELSFVACRLIHLDKKPGVCPIGIGNVLLTIIAKVILHIIGNDTQLSVWGSSDMCWP